MTNYIPLMLFPVLYVGARLYTRVTPVKADKMDFVSGLAEIEADTYDERASQQYQKVILIYSAQLYKTTLITHFSH